MNALIVGSDKEPILDYTSGKFLIIDDGPIIDALSLPERGSIAHFDTGIHSFNPLKDMDYLKAREFVEVLNAIFPEGENTLTKAAATFRILQALHAKPRKLSELIKDTKDTQYAYRKIQTLLLSPVLERVLTRPTNLSVKGTIIAGLDRAALGDLDCFVLANLLISQYPGQVVISDLGFYAGPFHNSLIRQGRRDCRHRLIRRSAEAQEQAADHP